MGHHHDHDDEAEFEHEHEQHEYEHAGGFLTGLLWGGLLGIGAGLLLAPAAGQATRQKLRDRAEFARHQALQAAEDARARAEDIQNAGRDMLEENKRRLVRTAEAVKHSAQEAWSGEPNTERPTPAPIAPEQGPSMYNLMGQAGASQASPGPARNGEAAKLPSAPTTNRPATHYSA